ncbi:MAG: isochorismatase family cysteine hydrolase, partial [Candidatus Hadarchaeales archaeon]
MTARAILVVDMIRDFVTGKLGFKGAEEAAKKLKPVLEVAREKGLPIIYICDSHKKSDPEISIWGEHAMKGTRGAEVIDELSPRKGE